MNMISKGSFNIGYGIFLILLSILFVIFNLAHPNWTSLEYLQIDDSIIFLALSLTFFYILFKGYSEYKSIDIYEDYIDIKWVFGLIRIRYFKNEIKQFGIVILNKSNYIYIKTIKYDFLILISVIDNDIDLLNQLKQWEIKRKDNSIISVYSSIEKKAGGIVMMILGAFLFTASLLECYLFPDTTVDINSLTPLSGRLISSPDIKKPGYKNPSQYITFNLEEYPEINFTIDASGYEVANLTRISRYHAGNYIDLYISSNDYNKKIAKTVYPTFKEKHLSWDFIHVYDAGPNNYKILSIEDYNKELMEVKESNYFFGLFPLGIGLGMIIWGINILKKSNLSY